MSLSILLTTNALEIAEEFEQIAIENRQQMSLAMFRAMSILKAQVQQNLRSESGLNVRSGTLLNSIAFDIQQKALEIEGRLGPENVPYAAIHEFGGEIPARFIKPRLKQALSWSGPEGTAFSSGHWMPKIQIPARPYLRPAVREHADAIAEKFAIFMTEPFEK